MGKQSTTKPSDGAYNAYRISSRSHEPVIVLATHLTEAIDVVVRWREKHTVGEAGLIIETGWGKALACGGRAHIDEAISRCNMPSIAHRYRADIGWEITRPEHVGKGWHR